MFKGSIVALGTPIKNHRVDDRALGKLIEMHVKSKTAAILVCGSTGQGNLLSPTERAEVIETALSHSEGRVPVIVGCGAPSTHEALMQVKQAEELGVSAALVVSPFYSRPSQKGIFEHFKHIHDHSNIPILLYNNPGRTGVDIGMDAVLSLAALERIVGIKDSTPDISRITQIKTQAKYNFGVYCGDDPMACGAFAMGADGIISITANIAPELMVNLWHLWENNQNQSMLELNRQLMPLHLSMTVETNPSPLAYAFSAMGLAANEVRLPLQPVNEKSEQKINKAISQLGLISHDHSTP